jgi:class 3 adenylate cyclase
MTVFKSILPLLLILFLHFHCSPKEQKIQPLAVKGILDLSEWNFTSDGVINLDGEWEFAFGELLEPDPVGDAYMRHLQGEIKYIPVPSQWQQQGYPADGFATYRLRVVLPEFATSKSVSVGDDMRHLNERGLSIAMTDTGTAYKMYINGKLASVNGTVGKSKKDSEPFMQHSVFSIDDFLYLIPFGSTIDTDSLGLKSPTKPKTIEILFHISNFHYHKAGLWDTVKLGSDLDINRAAKQTFVVDLIVFSSLFIMAIYHFGLYLSRRKDNSTFYFGLFCLLIAVRIISTNERIIFDAIHFLPFVVIHKLEYFSFYYGSFVFMQFVNAVFPNNFSRKWFIGLAILFIPCTFIVIFLPMSIYSRTLIFVQITLLVGILYVIKILISAILQKRVGAKLFLSGFLFFALALINDMLKARGILFTPYLTSYGLLIFIIFQATVLSRKFAGAFTESEKLSEELKVFSEGLEIKVAERTSEINSANEMTIKLIESPSLDDSLSIIFDSILTTYKIDIISLFFMQEGINQFIPYKLRGNSVPEEQFDYIRKSSTFFSENNSLFTLAANRNKITYVQKVNSKHIKNESEKEFVKYLDLKSLLYVPIYVSNQRLGMFVIFNVNKHLELTEDELSSFSRLSSQVAGVIQKGKILQETEIARTLAQKAKEQADIERGIALLAQKEAESERGKSEKLLLNILPEEVANELKEKGSVEPVFFESTSIMFTDFKGFTQIAEGLTPHELIRELDGCFTQFDKIIDRNNLEKLKTIGDSYMCAGGIPKVNATHAIDTCLAALEIQSFMNQMKEIKQMIGVPYWELRLGIHSGQIMAGVVGEKKFTYDIWGDTVNTASRMESSGTPGKINISSATYDLVKEFFDCEFRGMVNAKNKGDVAMYYVNGLKNEYSKEENKLIPNEIFWAKYRSI